MRKRKKETLKNKIFGLLFIILGVLSTLIDGDATFLVFALIIGIGLFFEKENVIDI